MSPWSPSGPNAPAAPACPTGKGTAPGYPIGPLLLVFSVDSAPWGEVWGGGCRGVGRRMKRSGEEDEEEWGG